MKKQSKNLHTILKQDIKAMNILIKQRMFCEHAPIIPEITTHLMNAGGKRLRPLLCMASAKIYDYTGRYHIYLAASVELIHTATLLHDDTIDESAKRRGKATANILWGNKSSILVGDYLFARAFQLMVETNDLQILNVLANAAAIIAKGEILQLSITGNLLTTKELYLQVVHSKTAALFAAATKVGGLIAKANDAHSQALYDYGNALGICFQIIDDLLDYSGQSLRLGKNIGDDFRNQKVTLPIIESMAKGNERERNFWRRVIEKGQQESGDFEQAQHLLNKYNCLQHSKVEAQLWAEKAYSALAILPQNNIVEILHQQIEHTITRTI